MTFKEKLESLGACDEAVAWAGDKTIKEAWETCDRGNWMLWLAHRAGVEARLIVLCACDCAETAGSHWKADHVLACVWAIDAARRFIEGGCDMEELDAAKYAAAAYAADAASYAAAYAAYAADSRRASLANSADIVRGRISVSMIRKGLGL